MAASGRKQTVTYLLFSKTFVFESLNNPRYWLVLIRSASLLLCHQACSLSAMGNGGEGRARLTAKALFFACASWIGAGGLLVPLYFPLLTVAAVSAAPTPKAIGTSINSSRAPRP